MTIYLYAREAHISVNCMNVQHFIRLNTRRREISFFLQFSFVVVSRYKKEKKKSMYNRTEGQGRKLRVISQLCWYVQKIISYEIYTRAFDGKGNENISVMKKERNGILRRICYVIYENEKKKKINKSRYDQFKLKILLRAYDEKIKTSVYVCPL